jgi:hypothetical protein
MLIAETDDVDSGAAAGLAGAGGGGGVAGFFFTSVMPHFGHFPGFLEVTSGCIGHS